MVLILASASFVRGMHIARRAVRSNRAPLSLASALKPFLLDYGAFERSHPDLPVTEIMLKQNLAIILLLLGTTAHAFAAGTATGVKPDALNRSGSTTSVLVVGSDVSVGDRIETGPTGNVQLLFDDQTRIVIGPRSTLEIEAYLLNGTGKDRFAVNALSGTFRFLSGNSPKPVYSIDTPTASIAVRGTKFDLTVSGADVRTLLYEGALQLCQGNNCIDLKDRCDIGSFGSQAGHFGWDGERADIAQSFPLPNIQSAFGADFRVSGAQACLSPRQAPKKEPRSSQDTAPEQPTSTNNTNFGSN